MKLKRWRAYRIETLVPFEGAETWFNPIFHPPSCPTFILSFTYDIPEPVPLIFPIIPNLYTII